MSLDAWCIAAALLGWFLLSIPHQLDTKLGKRVKRLNTFGLIPGWTFFAPTPGTTDYRFVFRDHVEGSYTDWHEVEWCEPRRVLDAVWHPSRYRTKLIVDCVSALSLTVTELAKAGIDTRRNPEAWMISVPYLVLLNAATQQPRLADGATRRQFAVIEQNPSLEDHAPRVVVFSAAHQLEAA